VCSPHASCRALWDVVSAHTDQTWFRIASPTLASAAEPWIGGGPRGRPHPPGPGSPPGFSLRLRPQPAHGGRPAFVPRTTERRQEMTGTARASNPHVRRRIWVSSLVATSASRTLSRWRHGFEPRWDYQGNVSVRDASSAGYPPSSSWCASVQPRSRERRDRSRRRANARSICRHHRFVGGVGVGGEGFRPMPAETVSRCS
jgi:hypothetical protein